ncbi:MAG TPA: hypothetical protein VHS59_11815 [Bacillota bacterium]|nr:hypothetical protein [Bacillota bacterium]
MVAFISSVEAETSSAAAADSWAMAEILLTDLLTWVLPAAICSVAAEFSSVIAAMFSVAADT